MLAGYPSYRQARTRWLPPVPEHWNEQRAKTFFREVDERSQTGEEELLSVSHLTGITPRSQKNVTMFKAESYVGSKLCCPGDIVINTLWAWMAALGVSKHAGIVSPAYGVYRTHKLGDFNPVYLDYLLRIRAYVAEYTCRSTGIRASRLRLYPDKFLDMTLIQPPLAEQEKIVHYLRTQDTKIARFIRIKRELIQRLNEQKLRLIDHAVTGGLDSVSESWKIKRLKDAAKIIAGQSPDSAHVVDAPNGLPFLQGSAEFGEKFPVSKSFCTHAAKIAPENSWLLSVRAPVGSINFANQPYCIGRGLAAIYSLKPDELHNDFLGYCLKNKQSFLMAISTGSIFQAISSHQIKSLEIKLPPIETQRKITRFLNEKIADISTAIAQSEQEITLIREYRERLIHDAVTGQIDLRGWQPRADDLTLEDDSLAAFADGDSQEEEETDAHE